MNGGTVVIGIGHPYRSDDGVGPAVVDLLGRDGAATLHLAVSSGEPVELIEAWDGADTVVLVDAAYDPHGQPGHVHRLSVEGPAGLTMTPTPATSSHAVGLDATLALARALDRMPGRIVLYVVEVADVAFGAELSAPVAAAAHTVADEIRRTATIT
jgi:hydrogenase maturation protease